MEEINIAMCLQNLSTSGGDPALQSPLMLLTYNARQRSGPHMTKTTEIHAAAKIQLARK